MTSEDEIEWYPLPEVEGGEGDWGREVTAAIVSGTPSSTNSEGIVIPVIHVEACTNSPTILMQLTSTTTRSMQTTSKRYQCVVSFSSQNSLETGRVTGMAMQRERFPGSY